MRSHAIRRFLFPLFLASLSLSIHLPSPFPILSVSSTREGRIADVFTIVVSLDRKVRHGCRYRACSLTLSLSFFVSSFFPARFLPSIPSWSFLIVARRENPKPRSSNSSLFDICHDRFFHGTLLLGTPVFSLCDLNSDAQILA